jgi:hypothetical protein
MPRRLLRLPVRLSTRVSASASVVVSRGVAPVALVALVALVGVILGTAAPARAEPPEPAGPARYYVVASIGTTVAYQPPSGSASGWQHDVSPSVGFGRELSETVSVEVDAGPTYVRGHYAGFSLVPGAVWIFSSHAYAAARVVVPVDPELNLVLAPGIGVAERLGKAAVVVAELNVSSAVGRGDLDLGVALTVGALYAF